MLPPPLCGGNGENEPASSSATPIVPRNFVNGTRTFGARLVDVPSRRSQILRCALGEVVGQQAEPRDHGRPAPRPGRQREDLDLERVAGLRTLDVDRAGEVVDRVEVPDDVLDRRVLVHLAVTCHQEVEVHDVARGDREHRRVRVVPVVVDQRAVERVLGQRPRLPV